MRRASWPVLAVGLWGTGIACHQSYQFDPAGPVPVASPLLVSANTAVTDCWPLRSAAGGTLLLGSGSAPISSLSPGGLMLLFQVQDRFATASTAEGVSVDLSSTDAGAYRLVQVGRITGGSVEVVGGTESLAGRSFGSSTGGRAAEACAVPTFQSVSVASGVAILARPWNGMAGGVIAFQTIDALTLAAGATLDASGAGFRGGPIANDATSQIHQLMWDLPAWQSGLGGGKGEGLDGGSFGMGARAAWANGAGGGNSLNAGGGGGGGGGPGGPGAPEVYDPSTDPSPDLRTHGTGGASLALDPTLRMIFGGGGGAGQESSSHGTAGSSGGGVVFLIVGRLEGGGAILADGRNAVNASNDGGGGGGAGGAIVVQGPTSGWTGRLSAVGGKGASTNGTGINAYLGPGGGGGGGIIALSGALPPGASTAVGGGAPGVEVHGSSSRGALAGGSGVVLSLP